MKNKKGLYIMTYGLNTEQNISIDESLPTKNYALFKAEDPTDLIAYKAAALIVNANILEEQDKNMLLGYYKEVGSFTDETVFWIEKGCANNRFPEPFKYYEDFNQFEKYIKYLLLSAHSRSKSGVEFSEKLRCCMQIMKDIRANPYISTRHIADRRRISERTALRYIKALQWAGEWIKYDSSKKGWYLEEGTSPFFDNF